MTSPRRPSEPVDAFDLIPGHEIVWVESAPVPWQSRPGFAHSGPGILVAAGAGLNSLVGIHSVSINPIQGNFFAREPATSSMEFFLPGKAFRNADLAEIEVPDPTRD